MTIGIFDSSLAGLGLRDAIAGALPGTGLIYLADTARGPYGARDPEEVLTLTRAGIERLWAEGCDLVVLASQTAGACALRHMQEGGLPQGKRVLGGFVPLIEALTGRNWGDNGPPREAPLQAAALFATPASVASRSFRRELAFRARGLDVEPQPCAGLAEAVDSADMALAEEIAAAHARALLRRMPAPEAAVLGCNHYAALAPVFARELGPDVRLLTPGDAVPAALADYIARRPAMAGAEGGERYLATGDPALAARATGRSFAKA